MKYQYKDMVFEIDDACLSFLGSHRQRSCFARETGGQLFARIHNRHVKLEIATETKGRSKRRRFMFWPDRAAERADIEALFIQGLHYVGDWHTHPEAVPIPSALDKSKMLEIFRLSSHELEVMLMIIVGNEIFPKGLFVGAVCADSVKKLHIES